MKACLECMHIKGIDDAGDTLSNQRSSLLVDFDLGGIRDLFDTYDNIHKKIILSRSLRTLRQQQGVKVNTVILRFAPIIQYSSLDCPIKSGNDTTGERFTYESDLYYTMEFFVK